MYHEMQAQNYGKSDNSMKNNVGKTDIFRIFAIGKTDIIMLYPSCRMFGVALRRICNPTQLSIRICNPHNYHL